MSSENAKHRLAVLIDAENSPHKHLDVILSAIEHYGTPVIKRAYGDWMLDQLKDWRETLHKHDIVQVQTLQIVAGKNLADIALTVDAMDIMYERIVDGICIVSSDSDFTPLVRRLQDGRLFVLGIGRKTTPDPFVIACDEFIKLETLINPQKPKVKKTKATKSLKLKDILAKINEPQARQLTALIIQTLTINANEWMPLGELGNNLKKADPKFSIKSYGFSTLSKGVETFPQLFQIKKQGTIKSVKFLGKNLRKLLIQAIKNADTLYVSLSTLGSNLREIDAEFDIKSYGFSSLGKAVEASTEFLEIGMQRGAKCVKLLEP